VSVLRDEGEGYDWLSKGREGEEERWVCPRTRVGLRLVGNVGPHILNDIPHTRKSYILSRVLFDREPGGVNVFVGAGIRPRLRFHDQEGGPASNASVRIQSPILVLYLKT
jgi:hypothetical protein